MILKPWREDRASDDCISVSYSTNAISLRPGTSLTSLNPGNLRRYIGRRRGRGRERERERGREGGRERERERERDQKHVSWFTSAYRHPRLYITIC